MSGGQRQRLAIARAIIKKPTILIFDEATSAIDVRGEQIVQKALARASQNRTTITIAHLLSTIRSADKIIVLAGGKAVEQGTHEELLTEQGIYHGLIHAQQLSLGTSIEEDVDKSTPEQKSDPMPTVREINNDTLLSNPERSTEYKVKGSWNSFGLLFREQRSHLPWLYLMLFGAFSAAGTLLRPIFQ